MKYAGKRIAPPEPSLADAPTPDEMANIAAGVAQLANRRAQAAAMIAQCDLNAPPPADLALWDAARPVGGEVL